MRVLLPADDQRQREAYRDLVVVLVVALLQIGGTILASRHQTGRTDFDVLGIVLLAAGPAALLVRNRYPRTVLVVAYATAFAYSLRGYAHGPIYFALIVALFTVIQQGDRIFAIVMLAIGWVSFLWGTYWFGPDDSPSIAAILGLGAWLIVLYAGCAAIVVRRERAQEAARRHVTEERLRIAREVHDIVSHNISMINVQAGVALHLMHEHPEQAELALTAIKDASRETLRELRAVLGVLRAVDEEAPTAPAPGLARLDELTRRAQAAGLGVTVDIEGEPRRLPAEVDLAAFRIVQEALTNATRHSGTKSSRVHVSYGSDEVTLEIIDNGRGFSPHATRNGGSGITGMRERASAVGGEFGIDRAPTGGTRVRARLPAPESR
jgi:signal transduction histidine kinase